MSKLQTLRALVIERVAAAAEDISALFERTTAGYEEQLCRSEEANHRRQRLLDQALSRRVLMNQGLNQDFTQTPRIKEEPEEHGISQEEEQLPVPVPESGAVSVKREESPFEQLMETEAEGDEDRRTKLSPNNKSAPETTVHNEDKSGPDGAEQKKKHQCSVCNKRFGFESQLQKHTRVHTGQKPYRCSSCEKAFTQKGDLDRHMRTHTGEKLFTCPTCKTKFANHSTLKNHLRTHTGERPYSCETCEKRFTQKCTLVAHRRTHTGERPYSCETCEKRFTQKCTLVAHRRTHTGERPYSCQTCEKTFSHISHLHAHRRTHTGEKPFACPVCDKTFAHKCNLQRHMKTH